MPRCENCGLRLEDETATLCPSCAYRRKKLAQQAAQAGTAVEAPKAPPQAPDRDALRERMRVVEETLKEPPPA